MDTIFALSSAQGKAGVAVIRISGPGALAAIQALAGDVPPVRQASVRVLRSGDGVRIDESLVIVFSENHSFTGQPTVEIHCHGSIAVVSTLLDALAGFDGLRPAQPGEFTRRALENGRLDLSQVEGLADLIDAETEAQRRQAMRLMSGELGRRAEEWRRNLIRAKALVEATIDFADEEIPDDVSPEVSRLVAEVIVSLRQEIAGVSAAECIRSGFEVAIVGAPNVGKSTLLNALAGREAAITSEHAGTTRDVIEVRMDLGGLPVTILDTAGLRDTSDAVESIGVDRARKRAARADLRVFLVEEGEHPSLESVPDDIVVTAKADLLGFPAYAVSGKTGFGVADLVGRIAGVLRQRASGAGVATRLRHRQAMVDGLAGLERVQNLATNGAVASELAAEDLRGAVRALDSLVGRIDVEDVLDEIFASFCIGK